MSCTRTGCSSDGRVLDEEIARRINDVEAQTTRLGNILRWFAVFGGLMGMIAAGWQAFKYFTGPDIHGSLEMFVTSAFASDLVKTELTSIIPFVAVGVLSLMGISFLIALGTLMLVEDTKPNQARIKAIS